MSSVAPEKTPLQAETELSREAIIASLREVADSGEQPRSLVELDAFIADQQVRDRFATAIVRLGYVPEPRLGEIHKGKRNGAGLTLHARYWEPPVLEGGSFLHVHGYESTEPSFGLVLPFDSEGQLDTERLISASISRIGAQNYSFVPEQPRAIEEEFPRKPMTEEETAQAAQSIAYVTQLSAAALVTLLELEDNAI